MRAVRTAASGRSVDFRAGSELLQQAEALIAELPPELRAKARFSVAVRKAEIQLRAGNLERAAQGITAARQDARATPGACSGVHRVLALVVLWQSLPSERFLSELGADRAYLQSAEATADARYLAVPLRLLQADLLLADGREREALAQLLAVRDEVRQTVDREPQLRPWQKLCAQRLLNFHYARHDYEQALAQIGDLAPEDQAAPRALLALQLGEFDEAAASGELAAAADPRFWQVVADAREMQGRFAEALAAYERAHLATTAPADRAAAANGRGDALLGLGDLAGAAVSYHAALQALAEVAPGPERAFERAECHKDLGRVDEALGQWAAARAQFAAALAEIEEARRNLPMDVLGDAFLEADTLLAVDGLLRLAQRGEGGLWEAAATLDAAKARGLLDWLAAPPTAARAKEVRSAVQALLVPGDPAGQRARLAALEHARASAGAGLRRFGAPLRAEALQALAAREPDTLFLCYWLDHDKGVGRARDRARLLVLRGTRIELLDLGARSDAERELVAAVEAMQDARRTPDAVLAAAAARYLPAALARYLAGAERVVFCPDSVLARLPFEALPVAGVPIGLAQVVERAPSLAVRQVLTRRAPRGEDALVLADVSPPPGLRESGLAALHFSAREGGLIAGCYPKARVLAGQAASLANLEAALAVQPYAVVHFSTHALANPAVPAAATLLLSDGLAPMSSLLGMPLAGSLVVLSACVSAGGAERGGEGVVGLLWGPLGAGACGAVASLWDVNQQATCDLMAQFHFARSQGHDTAQALRQARTVLARSAQYAHPHYWAGFGVYAGPGQEPPANSRAAWWWLAVVALLGGTGWWVAGARRRA